MRTPIENHTDSVSSPNSENTMSRAQVPTAPSPPPIAPPLRRNQAQRACKLLARQEALAHTSSTALMQPSFSGLLVTWAYLPHTTLPPGVTSPSSLTLTSITVPFVTTPSWV